MKIFKAFFIITFSFTLLLVTIAADDKDAGDIWLTAYSLYEKAEQYYNSEDYSSSFVYYQKALKKFNDLNCAYPDWNSELVSYRITHCEEKEAIIKNKLIRGNMDKSSDDLVKENIELQTRLADYQDKLTNEQTKLKDALSRTEKNQGEFLKINEATEKLKQVMKEKIELEKKYSLVNEGLGNGTIENSNLIETLRNDMEHQRKKLESVLQEKQKIENERNEFKKKYSDMAVQKADIDYRLKVEDEKFRNRESNYSQASKRVESLSDEIKRLTVEKNNLAGKLSEAKINLHEEHQSGCSLKSIIENNSNGAVVQLSKENSGLKKRVQDFQKEIDRLNGIKDSYSYELNKMKEVQGEASKTISSLQSRYSTVGEEIETLRKVLNENEARESEYSKKITEMAAKLAESKEEYTLLTDKYKDLENKQGNLEAVQSRNLDLEQEKKQLSEQIQNYQLQAEETKSQMASIREAKEMLEKEQVRLIQSDVSGSLESESNHAQKVADLSETSRKLKEMEDSNTEKERKLNELLNKMKSSEENYANLHRDNNKIQQELLNAETMIDGLRKTNSSQAKDASNLSDQLRLSNIKNQEYERIKDQLESSIHDSNSKLASLKKEHEAHLDKYNNLMEKYRNQEKLAEQIKNESKEKDKSLVEADKKLNELKEASNSEKANMNSVLDSVNKLSKIIDSKEREKKEVEKLLADSIEKNREYEQHEKHDTEKLQDLLNELKKRNKENEEFQKAGNDVLKKLAETNSELSRLRRHRDINNQEIERLKKQLNSLDEKSKNFSREKSELNKKITDYEQKVASSETELKNSQEEAKKLTDSLADYQKKLDSLRRENQGLKNATLDAGNRISSLEKDKKGLFEKIKALTDNLKEADNKGQHSNYLISLSEEKNISLNSKINEMEKVRGEQSSLIDSLQKQLEAVNKGNGGSNSDSEGLNPKLVEFLRELAASEEKISTQNSVAAKYQDDYKNLQKTLNEFQNSRKLLENKYAEAVAKVKSQETLNKEQEKRICDLLGRIDSFSVSLGESKRERDILTQQMVEHSAQFNKSKKDYESQIARLNSIIEEGRKNGGKAFQLTADNFELINNLKGAEEKIKDLEQRQEDQLKKVKTLSLSLNKESANNCEKEVFNKDIRVKLASATSRLNELEKERVTTSARVSELLNGISERDRLLQSQKEANSRMNSVLNQAQKSIADLKKKEIENSEKTENLLAQLQKSEQDKMSFTSENSRQRNDLSAMKSKLEKITTDNKNRNEELTRTAQNLNGSNIKLEMANVGLAELEGKYKSALNSSGEFEKKLLDSQAKVNELTAELKNVENSSKGKNAELNNLLDKARERAAKYKDFSVAEQARVKELEKQLFEYKNKVEAANKQFDKSLAMLTEAKASADRNMETVSKLQKKINSLTAESKKKDDTISKLGARKIALEDQLVQANKNIDEMAGKISSNNRKVTNLTTELNAFKKVSAKNGAGLEELNDKLAASAKKISEYKAREELYLSKNKALSEKLEEANRTVGECRKKQLLCESQNAAINYILKVMESKGENSESRITELVKSFNKTDFLTTIENDLPQKLKEQLLENQKNLVQINDKYEKLNGYNKGLLSKLDKIQTINADMISNNQRIMKDLDGAKSELSSVMQERTSLHGKMKDLLTQLNEISAENSEIKLQKQKLEKSLLSGNQGTRGKELDIVSSSRQIEGVTNKVNKLNESLSKSEKNVVSIQIEYEKILNKNMNIEKSFQSLNKQFTSVKNDLKESEIRAKNLESINRDFQERLLNEKNKTAALQREASEKTEIIKGLTKEIDGFKQQIADSATSQVLLRSNLENSLSVVESLKKDKSELLHRMESVVSESDKLAKVKKMTDEASVSKRQFSEINIASTSSTVVDYTAAKIRDLTQKNIELSKKLAKVTKRQKVRNFNEKNSNIALSLEDKKRVFKLISSASQSIKNNNNILAYRYLSKAADIVTDNYTLQKNTGILAMSCGDYANAIRYFTDAKYIKAENSEVSVSLGVCFLNINEPHKAFAEFAEATDIEGNKTELGKLLEAFCIGIASEYRKAKVSGKTLEQYLHSPEVAYKLAELLVACSPPKLQEAEKWYKIAVRNGAHFDSIMEQKFRNL